MLLCKVQARHGNGDSVAKDKDLTPAPRHYRVPKLTPLSSCLSRPFVGQKTFCYVKTDLRLPPNLGACPDADLENILELTCRVVPSVMITELVSWKIVFDGGLSSHAVS